MILYKNKKPDCLASYTATLTLGADIELLGAKNGMEIGSLRPKFNTPLKKAQINT